jgi:hypothetical protein
VEILGVIYERKGHIYIRGRPTCSSGEERVNARGKEPMLQKEEPQVITNYNLKADPQGPAHKKCSCVMCFPKGVPRSQEARMESSQASFIRGKAAQESWNRGDSEILQTLGSSVADTQFKENIRLTLVHQQEVAPNPNCGLLGT